MNQSNRQDVPIQPVERPILCNPYVEPTDHWLYDRETGEAGHGGMRRPAGYWYKNERTGSADRYLPGMTQEEHDDLPLVNALREDVRKWREAGYRGATKVTKELLLHWARPDLMRRLFFCQREAVETAIYLAELRIPGRSRRTGFQKFDLSDADLRKLLAGEKPGFPTAREDFYPTLIDKPSGEYPHGLIRLACKMATGSGKTVVMAMLVSWAFCNRGTNPASREFPNGVLVVCPNLTVKERLQVLRPDQPGNYYEHFDLVPSKYRPLLLAGKVLVTNWHGFAPESEHAEGGSSYKVVNKGAETGEAFARRILGDLYDRMPIMVLNDEGHHCWRAAPLEEKLERDEAAAVKAEVEEATVWIEGLDRINNAGPDGKPGILFCADTSATPFYIHGSGHPEGYPFPWIVSDFGLVDAIESGIVKIPRLPVSDTTGRPEAKYFKLWRAIDETIQPGERLPGKTRKPKPEVVYREAEAALKQIAGQWVERFKWIREATPGQDAVPPVLIIVCDNTDIAEVFYRKISGEREEDIVTPEDVEEAAEADENGQEEEAQAGRRKRRRGPKKRTVYGQGSVFPDYFSNTPTQRRRTFRIDSKMLAEAESEDPKKTRQTLGEEIRQIVATVGKPGQPGEHVRCVVSVGMLTEGWDANNVTQVLGIRAFKSQLLCEQVVGRGLRRMDYTPDPKTGMLTEEYVDVYGIPFSVIPFKGRPTGKKEPEDQPKNHVRAMEERKEMEMRFPVVEGYAFALRRNLVKCDVDAIDPLDIEVNREPTATFLLPTVGYQVGTPSKSSPFSFAKQDRQQYYAQTHVQTIKFQIARIIVDRLTGTMPGNGSAKHRVMRLQSRHQLFPQVYRFVDEYVSLRVNFNGINPCELGLEKYIERTVERLCDAIEPNDEEGEPPLLPVLNRYKPIGTTAEVDFKTVRPCHGTQQSHINQVVLDTDTWESTAAFRMEEAALAGVVSFYSRNDHMGLTIPYEYQGVDHAYEPDFLVRLANGLTIVMEIKGYEDDQTKAKHTAAKRWVSAVNNWGQLGRWAFHVCREPQQLGRELKYLLDKAGVDG